MPTGMPFWTGAGSTINLTAQGAISTTGFANLPAAADNPRVIAYVPDVGQGGSMWFSDGTVWRPVSRRLMLAAWDFGSGGITLNPGTAETMVGTNRFVPGGVVKPGDALEFIFLLAIDGTLDSNTKVARIRQSNTSTVTTSSTLFYSYGTTSNTARTIVGQVPAVHVLTNTSILRFNSTVGGAAASSSFSSNVQTVNSFASDAWYQPSLDTAATASSLTLYNIAMILIPRT